MRNDTRKITEGAMMCALVGLILFINRQLGGMIEYTIYWILSFPILIYTVRYGWKAALIPAVSMLLLSLMLSAWTTVFYLASALLCGIGYGYGVYHRWKHINLLLLTGVLTLFSYLITMVLFAAAFGYDPQEDLMLAQQLMQQLRIINGNITELVVMIAIITGVVCAFLQTVCIHLFACLLLKRMNYEIMPMKSIFDIALPKWFASISICIWLLFLLKNMLKLEGNLLVGITSIYFIDCIILCAECVMDVMCITILYQKRLIGIICSLLCIVGLLFLPSGILIVWCGIISIYQNFRQKWKRGVIHGTIGKS